MSLKILVLITNQTLKLAPNMYIYLLTLDNILEKPLSKFILSHQSTETQNAFDNTFGHWSRIILQGSININLCNCK